MAFHLAGRIAETDGLRDGLSPDRAGDVFAVLASLTTYRQVLDDYGWSLDACEVGPVKRSALCCSGSLACLDRETRRTPSITIRC